MSDDEYGNEKGCREHGHIHCTACSERRSRERLAHRAETAEARVWELEAERDDFERELLAARNENWGLIQQRIQLTSDFAALRATLAAVEAELIKAAKDARDCALTLRREVDRGIAIRQSAESKLSRAEVLDNSAEHYDQIRIALETVAQAPGEADDGGSDAPNEADAGKDAIKPHRHADEGGK